ncbi:MAG: AAA family ATPase, partial [Myxococcota bacterium]
DAAPAASSGVKAAVQTGHREPDLFANLLIAQDKQAMQHRGKYPVIALTFKDMKAAVWQEAFTQLRSLLSKEIDRHPECKQFEVAGFGDEERRQWARILSPHEATQSDWKQALQLLCKLLTLHYKQSPWLFLDEYDTPIHKAYMQSRQDKENIRDKNAYYNQMVTFIRGLLGMALKGNDAFLHKAVITGILRVAKEDIFSDLNNLGVYGVLDDPFAQFFGFTQPEVQQLLQQRQLRHTCAAVSEWYDGYLFGEDRPVTIYNPWSVVSYAANPTQHPKEYWINTGSTSLIEQLINSQNRADADAIESLLLGQSIERDVADNLALRELESLGEALWSVALTSGYVTAVRTRPGVLGRKALLRIPNREVRIAFQRIALSWLNKVPNNTSSSLVQALLDGDAVQFAQHLSLFVQATVSYFDVGSSTLQEHGGQQEWAYHMLMLGMLAHVTDEYRIRSNRESGQGRPDVLLIPVDPAEKRPGIVMEFKAARSPDTLEQAAQEALAQIEAKGYVAEFADHPPERVLAFGIAFHGKKTAVKHRVLLASNNGAKQAVSA